MSVTQADIADFSQFASQHVGKGDSELTLAQLAMRWQAAKERHEVIDAVREGLADIDAGRTQNAFEFVEEMRGKYNIPRDASPIVSLPQPAPAAMSRSVSILSLESVPAERRVGSMPSNWR